MKAKGFLKVALLLAVLPADAHAFAESKRHGVDQASRSRGDSFEKQLACIQDASRRSHISWYHPARYRAVFPILMYPLPFCRGVCR
ncbi:conserved hypothetical protein [Methylobacterium nodulans ORS 2060]|uniref:Uncharacterized protein n=1 Tax=Methylobacterium nodulans (strain LMG 21967 / CNCM I-2342 / ORS 2060) TaxID=460265 RepID=B8IFB5_METNO|nr:conserved hypothetical protein [Methylobacterium nodulans ORS 2060]